MATINNFNSKITNLVIGTQINSSSNETRKVQIKQKLDEIQRKLEEDDTICKKDAMEGALAVSDLKGILNSKDFDKSKISKSLSILGNISTVGSFVKDLILLINS
ncbi:hypothetical protein [Undibacterium sp. RuTC16W]|uniref:hypothetical protein n=1 Tax=Undibacterium sp. RuTC16W TaxID=3413048 RepID=UPI003BF1EFDB